MLSDDAASTADKAAALARLQMLVEPIDNANGKSAYSITDLGLEAMGIDRTALKGSVDEQILHVLYNGPDDICSVVS